MQEPSNRITTPSAESNTTEHNQPSILVMTIGRTTYTVSLHFSTTSKETINDKINRLIQRDINP